MAKYIPKPKDIIFIDGNGFVRYVIVSINPDKQTADVKSVSGAIGITHAVPWGKFHHLDEGQNALRIVREVTEGK